jgi:hypothetical protein
MVRRKEKNGKDGSLDFSSSPGKRACQTSQLINALQPLVLVASLVASLALEAFQKSLPGNPFIPSLLASSIVDLTGLLLGA